MELGPFPSEEVQSMRSGDGTVGGPLIPLWTLIPPSHPETLTNELIQCLL